MREDTVVQLRQPGSFDRARFLSGTGRRRQILWSILESISLSLWRFRPHEGATRLEDGSSAPVISSRSRQKNVPGSFEDDPLTEVLRLGARRLLGQAVEAEVAGFVEAYAHLTDSAGRRRIVRHGHLPEREIQTGIGPVAVRCPRVRDRGAGETGPRLRFTSRILPPYLRRAKSIEELLPWLYLKGISTGDFCEALAALLGPEAPGLSASTIARLKEVWQGEREHWQRRDLSAKRYVYFWADGVYFWELCR